MRTAFEMNNRAVILNLENKMMKTPSQSLEHKFATQEQRIEFHDYLLNKGYIVRNSMKDTLTSLVISW